MLRTLLIRQFTAFANRRQLHVRHPRVLITGEMMIDSTGSSCRDTLFLALVVQVDVGNLVFPWPNAYGRR